MTIPTVVSKTIRQLREDLTVAQEAYDRSHTYHNAVGVQQAKQAIEHYADERRASFKLVDGDNNHHDLTDVEVCGHALREIMTSIRGMESDAQIPGTLLYIYKVSRQALISTGKLHDHE